MAVELKPPVAFERPTPASQARSKASKALERARGRALSVATARPLAGEMARAQATLERALDGLARRSSGAMTRAALDRALMSYRASVSRALAAFGPRLEREALTLAKLGARSTADLLAGFEGKALGRPLARPSDVAASGRSRREAARHRVEVRAVGEFFSVARNAETVEELARWVHEEKPALKLLGHLERVARTEGMSVYNAAALEEMRLEQVRFPDLRKKLVETFDQRTADDSYFAHGQVRKLEEEFEDGAGRLYLYPPGRPNDRGVVIAWRASWVNED